MYINLKLILDFVIYYNFKIMFLYILYYILFFGLINYIKFFFNYLRVFLII